MATATDSEEVPSRWSRRQRCTEKDAELEESHSASAESKQGPIRPVEMRWV